ncbi:hypothetical protein NMY22_g136 [Coprinellus aureogranulatus]|nr:hypothetical protein NMY22_g136 [Coprinellus aureogranulatus]
MVSVVWLVLGALIVSVKADDKPCTVHGKGKYFDLTALKSSKDYHVTGTDDDLFPINMCQGVRTETYGIKDGAIKDEEVAAFIRRDHGDFVLGKVNTTLSIYDGRPRLVLSEGSKCKSSNGDTLDIRASTIVDFVCDPGVFGPGQPRLVAQLPPGKADAACAFVIEWKTHYACPIGEGGFIWNLFVFLAVTFLSLLAAYTVLGTLYNRYVLQLRGFDQIPQFSLESMKYHTFEAIDWLKDIAATLDIPGNHPYERARNPRTPNPVSHQAQAGGFSLHDDEANIGFSRQQPETNPVSHQTQVLAAEAQRAGEPQSLSQLPTSAPPPPKLMTGARVPVKLQVREASKAEREFMLGEEDEDDDDEDESDSEEDTPREENPPSGSQRTNQPPSNPSNKPLAVCGGAQGLCHSFVVRFQPFSQPSTSVSSSTPAPTTKMDDATPLQKSDSNARPDAYTLSYPAWQSQDMAPGNGGISIPSHDNGNGSAPQDDRNWNGGGRSPMREDRNPEPPRRSSRSRSPVRRDDREDRDRGERGGRDSGGNNPGNNLHVSGLAHKVDTRDLEAAFARSAGESRGFGFVTMESVEEADAAIVALNSTEFMGKIMTVEKARRARARTPTPGRYYGPPKRFEYERPYDPRPYDSRYSRDYDDRRDSRRGGGGGGRDDYYRRDYDRRDDYRDRDRGDRYNRDDRRYDDRRSHITGLLPLLHVTPMYRVFLGAPPASALNSTESYHWQTISTSDLRHPHSTPLTAANSNEQESFMQWPKSISASRLQRADSFMYLPATLEAASRRISMIYRNAIFDRTEAGDADEPEEEEGEDGGRQLRGDMTTVITWPPTNPGEGDSVGEASRLTRSRGSVSFLRSGSQDESMAPPPAPDGEISAVSDSGFFESQQTQSFNYSDASSIARFPTFHFNIHALSSLSQLTKVPNAQGRLVSATVKGRKVNLLLAILEVDGPETITIRNGKDAGKKVGLLKLILGDQEGSVCKLTAWREVAEEWGGVGKGLGCKRGDVVHLENVTVDCDPSTSPNLTASPNLKSKMIVCYRTMPYAHEDGVFRPDLRLGESDPCVRKVAAVRRFYVSASNRTITVVDLNRPLKDTDLHRYLTYYAPRIRKIPITASPGVTMFSLQARKGLQWAINDGPGTLSPNLKKFARDNFDLLVEGFDPRPAADTFSYTSLFTWVNTRSVTYASDRHLALGAVVYPSSKNVPNLEHLVLETNDSPLIHYALTSSPWTHLKDLTSLSIEAEDIPHISFLPQVAQFTIRKPADLSTSPTKPACGAFSSLKALAIRRGEDAHHWLLSGTSTGILKCNNSHLKVEDDYLAYNEWRWLQDSDIMVYERDDMALIRQTDITPLFNFKELQHLMFCVRGRARITAEDVNAITESWPQLQSLELCGTHSIAQNPYVDHTHLSTILHGCPLLEHLDLPLTLPGSQNPRNCPTPFAKLQQLHVCDAPIISPSRVGSFIKHNFPGLKVLDVQHTWAYMECKNQTRWDAVAKAFGSEQRWSR